MRSVGDAQKRILCARTDISSLNPCSLLAGISDCQQLNSSVLTRCLKVDTLGCVPGSRYGDSLRPGQCGDRNLVGAKFSIPFYAVPDAQPASCAMLSAVFPAAEAAREWR